MVCPGIVLVCLFVPLSDPVGVRDLSAPDVATRLRAVQQVERLGAEGEPDARYLPALVPLLRDPSERLRGLAALAVSRHIGAASGLTDAATQELVRALLEGLREERSHQAGFCRRSLLVLGDRALPEVAQWLQADAVTPRSQADRRLALEFCRTLCQQQPQSAGERLIWQVLNDPDPSLAERARLALLLLNDAPNRPAKTVDLAVLRPALESPHPTIRTLVRRRLRAYQAQAYPSVLKLLESRNETFRQEGAELLRQLLAEGVIPGADSYWQVQAHLKQTRTLEAEAAVVQLRDSLGRRLKVEPLPLARMERYLAEFAQPESDRGKILRDLRDMGETAHRVLEDCWESNHVFWQQMTLEIAVELADSFRPTLRGQEVLALALLAPRDETARLAARIVSRSAGRTLAAPVLLMALAAAVRDTDPSIRNDAILTLARLGPAAESTLVALLQDREPAAASAAVQVIAVQFREKGVIPESAEPHLERLTRSRDAALAALATATLQPYRDLRRLRNAAPDERNAILRRLAQPGAEGQGSVYLLPELAGLLAAPERESRLLAARALERHATAPSDAADGTVVAGLLAHFRSEDGPIAIPCERALEALGARAIPELHRWLRGDEKARPPADRWLALEACRVLGRQEKCRPEVEVLLWRVLTDREPSLAEAARIQLVDLRNTAWKATAPERAALLAALAGSNPRIRALGRAQVLALPEQAFSILVALMESADVIDRPEVLELAEQLLNAKCLPTPSEAGRLVIAARRGMPDLSKDAQRTLERLANLRSLPDLPEPAVLAEVNNAYADALADGRGWSLLLERVRPLKAAGLRALEFRLESTDEEIQLMTLETLLRLHESWYPTASALERLGVLLASPRERIALRTAETLRWVIRSDRHVPVGLQKALGRGFERPNHSFRAYCVRSLAACGWQARSTVLELLDDSSPAVKLHALVVLNLMAGQPAMRTDGFYAAVDRLRSSPDRSVASLAEEILSGLPRPSPLSPESAQVDAWLQRLGAGTGKWHEAVNEWMKTPGAVRRTLEDRMLSSSYQVRHLAALGLAALLNDISPSPRTLEALAGGVVDWNSATAVICARTLRRVLQPTQEIPPSVLPALVIGLESSDASIRYSCVIAMAACGRRAEPFVVALLERDDTRTRYLACLVLLEMQNDYQLAFESTVPPLRKLANSGDDATRAVAVQLLQLMEGRQGLSPGNLRTLEDLVEQRIRENVNPGLFSRELKEFRPVVLEILERRVQQRIAGQTQTLLLLEALFENDRASPRLLSTLVGLLTSPEDEAAKSAGRLLIRLLRAESKRPDQLPISAAVLDALVGLFEDRRPELVMAGIHGLAACGLQAESRLVFLLGNKEEAIRAYAAWSIRVMVAEHGVVPTRTRELLTNIEKTTTRTEVRDAASAALRVMPR